MAFGLVDGAPVFRATSDVVRLAAEQNEVCCFEVDDADEAWSWAWSVTMIGRLVAVADGPLLDRARQLGLPDWSVPGDAAGGNGATLPRGAPEYVLLHPATVTGRWYGPPDSAPA